MVDGKEEKDMRLVSRGNREERMDKRNMYECGFEGKRIRKVEK